MGRLAQTLGVKNPFHPHTPFQIQTSATKAMKPRTKLRLLGGTILLFNLWLIGHYSIEGIPVILMTFGFAIAYEYVVVRRAAE